MKKKLLATITALSLAATCASALVACGDDGYETLTINETQWKTAINAAIADDDFEVVYGAYIESQGAYSDEMRLFYVKENNTYYMDLWTKDGVISRYLHKKGDRYYRAEWDNGEQAQCAELVTKAEFDSSVAQSAGMYDTILDNVLEQVRDTYGKFKSNGGDGGFSHDGVITRYATYLANNYSFTMKSIKTIDQNGPVFEDIEYTAETVWVKVTENDTLLEIMIEGMLAVDGEEDAPKTSITYMPIANIEQELDSSTIHMLYPEVLGHTFTLESVKVDTYDETFTEMANDMEDQYKNKAVTCAANGKLSGDIEFAGKAISQFTLTDDYGDIKVEGPDDITLTGECFVNRSYYEIDLKLYLTIPTQNGDVTFTFTFVRY